MIFKMFSRPNATSQTGKALFEAVRRRSRNPELFGDTRIPDTVEGRFESLVLHAALVMRRLRVEGEAGEVAAQHLFDVLFDDMDAALRELGVGDLIVGKRIRKMGEAFYGRARAYDAAIASENDAELEETIARNLLVDSAPSAADLAFFGTYVRDLVALLDARAGADVLSGSDVFASST